MKYALVLLAGIAFFGGCNAGNREREEPEVEVTLSQVPPAVKEALARESGGAPMGTVVREVENGRTVYEAKYTSGGKTWEVEVDETGKLLEKEEADD